MKEKLIGINICVSLDGFTEEFKKHLESKIEDIVYDLDSTKYDLQHFETRIDNVGGQKYYHMQARP